MSSAFTADLEHSAYKRLPYGTRIGAIYCWLTLLPGRGQTVESTRHDALFCRVEGRCLRVSAYQSPLNRITHVRLALPGQGEGLEAKKPTPFRAKLRLHEQQGHLRDQSRQGTSSDCRNSVEVDLCKGREGFARDGKQPVEITGR